MAPSPPPPALPTHRPASHPPAQLPHAHFPPAPKEATEDAEAASDPEPSTWSTPESRESVEKPEPGALTDGLRRRATVGSDKRLRSVASHYSDKDDLDFDWGSSSMGAEPGVDPRKANFDHMDMEVTVYVVDWAPERVKERRFTGDAFLRWWGGGERAGKRPPWAKARWVNVDGLNWPVIKAVALYYDLHPLALEDAIKFAAHSNSKADWYSNQLFTRILIHSLCTKPPNKGAQTSMTQSLLSWFGMSKYQRHARHVLGGDSEKAGTFAFGAGSDDPSHVHGIDAQFDAYGEPEANDPIPSDVDSETASVLDDRLEEQLAAKSVVNHLTEDMRVRIDRQQLSTFLLPSNEIISIFTHSGERLTRAIIKRLHTPGTLLRTTSDASMLLEAVIDVVVDDSIKISEEFRRELDVLEGRALVDPDVTSVRHLHVLSGQLLMLKRAMTPLQALIHSLCHDDDVRGTLARLGSVPHPDAPLSVHKGFLSPEAKLYLADVQDHIDSVLSTLELFSGMASSIVDFIFNSLTFSNNVQAKWLTIITIIFLPLSFLTGYFGMNFSIFPEVGVFAEGTTPSGPNANGGIAYFWKITGPLLAALCGVIFLANFGQLGLSLGRQGLRKIERRKHHKVIEARRRRKSTKRP